MPALYKDSNGHFTIELINSRRNEYKQFERGQPSPKRYASKRCWPSKRDGKYYNGFTYFEKYDQWIKGRFVTKHQYTYKIGARYSRRLLSSLGMFTAKRWLGQITMKAESSGDYADWINLFKKEALEAVRKMRQENSGIIYLNVDELKKKYKEFTESVMDSDDNENEESELIISPNSSPVLATARRRRRRSSQ